MRMRIGCRLILAAIMPVLSMCALADDGGKGWVEYLLASRSELRQANGADIRFSQWQSLGCYRPAYTGTFESVISPPVSADTNNWTVIRPGMPSGRFECEAGVPQPPNVGPGEPGDALAACIIESTADVVLGLNLGGSSLKQLHLNGQDIAVHRTNQQFYAVQNRTVTLRLKKGVNHLVALLSWRGRAEITYTYIMPADYAAELLAKSSWERFPVESDWWLRDNGGDMWQWTPDRWDGLGHFGNYLKVERAVSFECNIISNALARIKPDPASLRAEFETLKKTIQSPDDRRWLDLYVKCRLEGRARFLQPFRKLAREIIYTRHQVLGRGIYNISEVDPDEFATDMRIIDLDASAKSTQSTNQLLLSAEKGVIRDPALDYDGKRLLFSWRKERIWGDNPGQQYQIYLMDLPSRQIVRQLTSTNTYGASYEPCWLADGNIIFNSARIIQHITCGWGDCSNLYIMDDQGRYQRRLAFDQVSDNFPTQLEDGRVLYLRRDYNDRGQVGAHVLIAMNQDGTGALGYYGGNTFHPVSFQHFRGIPGSSKAMGVISGYHAAQGGKLVVMDVNKGRQRLDGLIDIPSGEKPKVTRTGGDNYGKEGIQYSHPFPLDTERFLVGMTPIGAHFNWNHTQINGEPVIRYAIYAMTTDGERELLAADPETSCMQPVPVMKRKRPYVRASSVDYRKTNGVFYVQDVYAGQSMQGVTRGTAKKLRVVALHYKYDTQNCIQSKDGPGGYGTSVCAIGMETACYDVKQIIGEVPIEEDGSVMFEAPARIPVYFQILDANNRMIQTMRSWTTLQPNEKMSCVGCHEHPDDAGKSKATMASRKAPVKLTPFYGPPRGFSYRAEVQPVWDKNCVSCHAPGKQGQKLNLTSEPVKAMTPDPYDTHCPNREWYRSYVELTGANLVLCPKPFSEETRYIKWIPRLSGMELLPPYFAGANRSKLLTMMDSGHNGVKLSREDFDKVAAWLDLCIPFCGTYDEANLWPEVSVKFHKERVAERLRNEAIDQKNIEEFIAAGQGK